MTKNKVLPHWDNRQTRTKNKRLFTRRTQRRGFGPLPQSHLDADWFCALWPPCCQNFESRRAWFKPVNRRKKKKKKHFKSVWDFKFGGDLKSPACGRYCVLRMPATLMHLHSGKWSNVISGARKPQSSCLAKWYSWKAVKNRVALDQSNDDPAGRAEQLKKSPGERWELLTGTEGLHSPPPSLSRDQQSSALMKTLLEILKKH